MFLVYVFLSCDRETRVQEAILGTWVSADQADTLVFMNEERFEKNSAYEGYMVPYMYSIYHHSITIQYSGPNYTNYILVKPTTHYFHLEEEKLIIDFSNGCYGFPKERLYYGR